MRYRKLKGTGLFNGHELLQNKVLVLAADSTVEAVIPESEEGDEIETFSGILMPGFINCHCHLELSHLKGKIEAGKGLVPFLLSVIGMRQSEGAEKNRAMEAAATELYNNGVAGVADICNTTDAITAKKNSPLKWQSFVEVLNVLDAKLPERLELYKKITDEHNINNLPAVLVPHAPYSISAETFKALNTTTAGAVISIHNGETAAENEIFKTGTGAFLGLYAAMGLQASPLEISGKGSLQTWLPHFTNGQTILLIHNTFISEEDILFAKEHARKYDLNLVYCLCPNANLYIENRLPPVDLLLKHDCAIVLGTDSYSSNWQLSIAAEIKTLRKVFPQLPLATILGWATANGAAALRWNSLGAFERGKKPGVVLLKADFSVQRLV